MSSPATELPLQLTDKALEHVRKTMLREGVDGHGLRIAVVTGGCSGNEYALTFAAAPEIGDSVYTVNGLRVFVDVASVEKLAGTVLDYVDGLHGAGLKFRNPNATHQCGCGTSFSVG
jgi:iron-sulfur cluster assembly accessory protein